MIRRLSAVIVLLTIIVAAVAAWGQDPSIAPEGILLGNSWHPETRELTVVFPDQTILELGEEGVRTVQLWTDIRNSAGKEYVWIVVYSNGLSQEILTQKIRYDRFRTYLEKTFRRKLWDPGTKKLVDVSGLCKVMLLEKSDPQKIIAVKNFTLR